MIGEPLRVSLCNWLTANGIDIKDIPIDASAALAASRLTIEAFVRGDDGRHVWVEEANTSMRQVRTFEVTTPPPPDVAEWLRAQSQQSDTPR